MNIYVRYLNTWNIVLAIIDVAIQNCDSACGVWMWTVESGS